MNTPIIVLGAGLHGQNAIEIFNSQDRPINGFLDDNPALKDGVVAGVPYAGTLVDLERFAGEEDLGAFVGIGNLSLLDFRVNLYTKAFKLGFTMVSALHETAFVSPSAQLGDGLYLAPQCSISARCRIGDNVCLYSGSTIDHDSNVDDHVFIGPGVHTAGEVHIGEGTYLSTGVSVGSGCRIGSRCLIAAGAVVVNDIPDGSVVKGVPGRVTETLSDWKARR